MNWKLHKFVGRTEQITSPLYPAANLLTDLLSNLKPQKVLEIAEYSLAGFIDEQLEFYTNTAHTNTNLQIRHIEALDNLPTVDLAHISLPTTFSLEDIRKVIDKCKVVILTLASDSSWEQYDQLKTGLKSFMKFPDLEIFTHELINLPTEIVASEYYQALFTGLKYQQLNHQLQVELDEQTAVIEELKLGGQNINARLLRMRDDLHRHQTILNHPVIKSAVRIGRSIRRVKRKLTR